MPLPDKEVSRVGVKMIRRVGSRREVDYMLAEKALVLDLGAEAHHLVARGVEGVTIDALRQDAPVGGQDSLKEDSVLRRAPDPSRHQPLNAISVRIPTHVFTFSFDSPWTSGVHSFASTRRDPRSDTLILATLRDSNA